MALVVHALHGASPAGKHQHLLGTAPHRDRILVAIILGIAAYAAFVGSGCALVVPGCALSTTRHLGLACAQTPFQLPVGIPKNIQGRTTQTLRRAAKKSDGNRESSSGRLPRVVFLGSPGCVCSVLQKLWDSAGTSQVPYNLCAVVSQPPKLVGKKKVLTKTPIHELAESLGVAHIWVPEAAKDKDFLRALEAVEPDVCITAAYGQYLPKRFLRAPKKGTLNLHPSLLPRWRGASPVQRALVEGDDETGITILYTVSKMDAGPIALQRSAKLYGNETSTQLLHDYFKWGADLLVDEVLPRVLQGKLTKKKAQVQDESLVTHAQMISKSEGQLWPHNETARQMRDKVRGFDGWPGATLPVACSGSKAPLQGYRVKVAGARIASIESLPLEDRERPLEELVLMPAQGAHPPAVAVRPASDPEHIFLVETLHIPGKQPVPAATFHKGYMSTQPARWIDPSEEEKLAAKPPAKAKRKRTRG